MGVVTQGKESVSIVVNGVENSNESDVVEQEGLVECTVVMDTSMSQSDSVVGDVIVGVLFTDWARLSLLVGGANSGETCPPCRLSLGGVGEICD